MKYIRKYSQYSQYDTYMDGNNVVLPNVSYCADKQKSYINRKNETRLIAIYNVYTTSAETKILYTNLNISALKIDDDKYFKYICSYKFNTAGDHIIKFSYGNHNNMDSNQFKNCKELKKVILSNTISIINASAFDGCSALTSITIPDSVTSIGNYAFYGCSSLTSVTIPDSVTLISGYAFYGCTLLASVTVLATTPPTLSPAAFSSNASGRKIYVPAASLNAYKTASVWSSYASYIEAIPA